MQPHQHPQQQPHVHGPNCSHGHKHATMEIPRVFLVYSCLSGQMLQRFFLQLPMMVQFYQIYLMVKTMVWNQPMDFYFQGVNSSIQRLPSVYLRRLLGGFAIPFFVFNYCSVSYVVSRQVPNLSDPYVIEFLIDCALVSSCILYVALFFLEPGYLTSKEDKEEFQRLSQQRPDIANPRNICHFCVQPKIARSFHCNFCGSCVTKWEMHSFLFNRCVGAGNQLLYLCFNFSFTILYFLLFSATLMKKTTPHGHTLWGAIVFFLILYNLITGFTETMIQTVSVFYNITSFELMNCRRLNYLWKNKHGEFFNPFDKGPLHNIREALESLLPQNVTNATSQDLENSEMPINHLEAVINWRKAKIFTVLDIPNSPLRAIVLEEMRKMTSRENPAKISTNNENPNPMNIKKENPFEEGFQAVHGQRKENERGEQTENESLIGKPEDSSSNPFMG